MPDIIDPTVAAVLRDRRTIASFRPEMPPRELVLAAVDLARWAPNHKKTQPWRFVCLGPETVQRVLALNTRCLAETRGLDEARAKSEKWARVPGWIIVTSVVADDPFRREEDYAACCCAIQNLQLALWSAGVGTKWATGEITRHPEFLPLLGRDPDIERVVGMIWYGYPDVIPEQSRGPLADVMVELP